jgi:flagellar protein FliL
VPIEQRVMNAPQRPGAAQAGGGIKPKADAAAPEAEPKKSKKKLFVVVGIVVVALAAAAYYFLVMSAGGAEAEEPAPEAGEVFTVEAMSINLADGHYLRLGLGLQLTAEAHELDAAKARDAAIVLFSGKSVAEVSDPASRDALKTELAHQLDELYEGEVMGVYLTDFVTQ